MNHTEIVGNERRRPTISATTTGPYHMAYSFNIPLSFWSMMDTNHTMQYNIWWNYVHEYDFDQMSEELFTIHLHSQPLLLHLRIVHLQRWHLGIVGIR